MTKVNRNYFCIFKHRFANSYVNSLAFKLSDIVKCSGNITLKRFCHLSASFLFLGLFALKSGKLYGAAVDVLTQEPPKAGSPLIGLDNCIISPHVAWASYEARQRLMNIASGNLAAFQKGEKLNVVN